MNTHTKVLWTKIKKQSPPKSDKLQIHYTPFWTQLQHIFLMLTEIFFKCVNFKKILSSIFITCIWVSNGARSVEKTLVCFIIKILILFCILPEKLSDFLKLCGKVIIKQKKRFCIGANCLPFSQSTDEYHKFENGKVQEFLFGWQN